MSESRLTFHRISEIFPMIEGKEFNGLVSDIRAYGVREPIWIYEGQIIDGRNRYRASEIAGVDCPMRQYDGDDPVAFVLSLNLKRRHLTASQLAFVALEIEKVEAVLAKERQGARTDLVALMPQSDVGRARDKAAEKVGVGARYVSYAKSIQEKAPEIAEKIKSGTLTITQAKRDLKERARESRREDNRQKVAQVSDPKSLVGSAKFATITIDPPWDWGDEGDVDQLGRARPVYETMSIEQLTSLPVGELADEDSHLYLWITNRSLPKGFALLEAWGFRYITCVTWVKPHFGMGNYFRGQTEQVLFGVKGSQPLKRKDAPTVFYAPRGPIGHSSKPSEFCDFIESCSPGPYLEMFSRSNRPGWTHWGEDSNAAAA